MRIYKKYIKNKKTDKFYNLPTKKKKKKKKINERLYLIEQKYYINIRTFLVK